ncbi:MAG: glycoside hydrolase family 15 protein [Burkholderiales bacterium]|nr:glycoside hydrolase family 15 protein [Burkholderiales bacterium]
MKRSLELGMIGNAGIAALVDERAEIAWCCLPRVDGDPVFCSLLRSRDAAGGGAGFFAVELADFATSEQRYVPNTAVLVTTITDSRGGAIEVTDFAPRFRQFGRMFCPMMLVRRLRRVAGSPLVTVRLAPACGLGAAVPARTWGSNHVRYTGADFVLRLTTNASTCAVLEETPFVLTGELDFLLGPDETLQGAPSEVARRFCEATVDYWQDWVRDLSIPFEWQDAVIRAAITLKLSAVDDTGAIIAAPTTSIPEAIGSARNWDYRYCWLRDAYFTVNALNRLNATRTMERYLGYIVNLAALAKGGALQPVYRINGRPDMPEHVAPALPGFCGMGPVRIGNQAHLQVQNDVYGAAILAATHVFFDRRLGAQGNEGLFEHLEALGEVAARVWREPDAGLWELRGSQKVHTFSALMCWVACDRLARIAARLGQGERECYWRAYAGQIRLGIEAAAWHSGRGTFVADFGGESLDASLLLIAELGFVAPTDPRFAATVAAIESELKRGDFIFRYSGEDDFGAPQNAFLVCTFWYIDALASLGRRDEARRLFENLLACRTRLGLLAEHIDPVSRQLWGNFPQTYSMVGLIHSATRLSAPWEGAF